MLPMRVCGGCTPHPEAGLPYANVLWEGLGLRCGGSGPISQEFAHVRSFRELGEQFGILFVTKSERDAGRYGTPVKIDLEDENVLAVIEDPHVRTHSGWIVIMPVGAKIPVVGLDPVASRHP